MLVTMQVVVHISIAFFPAVVDVDDASNLAISFGRTDGLYQAFDTITLYTVAPHSGPIIERGRPLSLSWVFLGTIQFEYRMDVFGL